MIERLFKLSENGTNARTEVLAGWLTYVLAIVLGLYFVFVRSNMGYR